MLQECHLPQSALGEMRRMVHKRLPAYCVFACQPNQSSRRDTSIQVVTLVHYLLAARASLLDVTSQLEALGSEAPEARSRTHFLRVLDPLSHVSLLLGNVYQYQAEQPGQQAALLKLMSSVVERWGGRRTTSSSVVTGTPPSALGLAILATRSLLGPMRVYEPGVKQRTSRVRRRSSRRGLASMTRDERSSTASSGSRSQGSLASRTLRPSSPQTLRLTTAGSRCSCASRR